MANLFCFSKKKITGKGMEEVFETTELNNDSLIWCNDSSQN